MIRFLTSGESHGKGLAGIVEGLPSGMEISTSYIHGQLKRRKLGYGRGARQKIEDDGVEILSGVRHGKTLGSPICLLILNKDWKNWSDIMQTDPTTKPVKRKVDIPRPGHADLVGGIKYNHEDMRNVLERSSARETTMRVGLASVVRKFLEDCGIHIASRILRIGSVLDESSPDVSVEQMNEKVDASPVRCLDSKAEKEMVAEIEKKKKEGNTLGGIFEVYASGVPLGLGSYAHWDRRLEGKIGQHFMSLNAIKGVEMGLGFALGSLPGSEAHDEIFPGSRRGKVHYLTNRSGGIDGGMTTGQIVVVRSVMKPLSTLMKPLNSVNMASNESAKAHLERSDVCAVPSASVIGESLLAMALAEAVVEKFGGDSMKEILPRLEEWNENTQPE